MVNSSDMFEGLSDTSDIQSKLMNKPSAKSKVRKVIVSFEDESGVQAFAELINQTIKPKTKDIWFPPKKDNLFSNLFEVDDRAYVDKNASGTRETKASKTVSSDVFDFPLDFYNYHWQNMPAFNQPNNAAYRQIVVNLEFEQDVDDFFKRIDQTYTDKTKSIWFPQREKNNLVETYWIQEQE